MSNDKKSLIPGAGAILSENPVGEALGKVDIEAIVSSFGVAIAKSQAALDHNSVQQLIALKDGVAAFEGKSLLQMGFVPSFYNFSTAKIDFSMAMSMAVKQDTGFDLELDSDVDKTVTKSSEYGKTRVVRGQKDLGIKLHKERTLNFDNVSSVYDISRSNSASDDYLLLGNKVAVSEFAGAEKSTNSRLEVNDSAGLIIFPAVDNARWSIFEISTPLVDASATKDFKVFTTTGTPPQMSVTVTGPKSLEEMATELKTFIETENSDLDVYTFGFGPGVDETVYFDFDVHELGTVGGINYPKRMTALNHVLREMDIAVTKIEGFADAPGREDYNVGISKCRANNVKARLKVAGSLGTLAAGEPGATVATPSPTPNQADRRVEISTSLETPTYYVYVVEKTETASPEIRIATDPDGPLKGGTFGASGYEHNGTTYTANSAVALANEINTNANAGYKAEAIGNEVHIIKSDSEEFAEIEIFARDSENGFRHGEASVELTGTKTREVSATKATEKTVNRNAVTGLSLDARYSRQFNVDMSGNLNVVAELTAVPPPAKMIEFFQKNNSFAE